MIHMMSNCKMLRHYEEPEVTPDWRDKCMIAEILLQREDKMARGPVICWKQDADGNLIGRSNKNPLLVMVFIRWSFQGLK